MFINALVLFHIFSIKRVLASMLVFLPVLAASQVLAASKGTPGCGVVETMTEEIAISPGGIPASIVIQTESRMRDNRREGVTSSIRKGDISSQMCQPQKPTMTPVNAFSEARISG